MEPPSFQCAGEDDREGQLLPLVKEGVTAVCKITCCVELGFLIFVYHGSLFRNQKYCNINSFLNKTDS